jgi:hypothetical protein
MPSVLRPIKKYRKYTDAVTGKKLYCPVYRGIDLPFSRFPPVFWQYTRAEEAQEHAERHELRKRLQIARFQDVDYRTAVLTRYAALLLIAAKQQEEEEDE